MKRFINSYQILQGNNENVEYIDNSYNINIEWLKEYILKISAQGSYIEFKFHQGSGLEAVPQKLNRQFTIKCPKEHILKVSAQSIQQLRSSSYNEFEINWSNSLEHK